MRKQEIIRRVRLGHLKRLLRQRYGFELPDDDAGREDLELVLCLTGDKNLMNTVEVWAPWMQTIEADRLVARIKNMPPHVRQLPPKTLGQCVRLTNVERERSSPWQIRPCDISDEEFVEQRKAKDRARKRRKRGSVPLEVYRARRSVNKEKPWIMQGISRAQWYRRRRRKEMRQRRPR